ncbi:hypothetical protein H0207_04840 [Shigella flexneri]|nr:hypothetical protein [Shigella flexneri]
MIVGILCGGMMMMILPSSSDATALLTALKNMHARLLEHASLLWQPETNDAIRAAHEGGGWADTDHEFAAYPGFLEPLSFSPAKRAP